MPDNTEPDENNNGRGATPAASAKPEGSALAATIEQLVAAGKLLLVALFFVFVTVNWSFFSEWARTIKHAEGFGFKIDREQADENIRQLFEVNKREGDPSIVRAALKQAELLSPAIQGAQVLWVDPIPDNNRYERKLLEEMGIAVQLAWSTEEALRLLEVADENPDLVISNMVRKDDENAPLSKCLGAYYEFPDAKLRDQYNDDIWQLNAYQQKNPPAGFEMAELMASRRPDIFGDHQRPRIIFYTLASGGKASNACARIVTNRPDVLLESVLGALLTIRGGRLADFKLVQNSLKD